MNSHTYESGRLLLDISRSKQVKADEYGPQQAPHRVTGGLTRICDIAAMIGAVLCSSVVAAFVSLNLPIGSQAIVAAIAVLTGTIATKQLGAYPNDATSRSETSLLRLLGFSLGGVAGILCTFLLPASFENAALWPIFWLLSSLMLAFAFQSIGDKAYPRLLASGHVGKRVVIVGVNQYSAAFIERSKSSNEPVHVVGVYDDTDSMVSNALSVPVRGRIEDMLVDDKLGRVDAVILAIPLAEADRIASARRILQAFAADIYLMAGPASLHFSADQIEDVGSSPVVGVCSRPLDRWQALQKSLFDRSIAAALLLFLVPVLAGVALAIKCTSPGPILFSQPRLGFNNRMFKILKFRSMYVGDTDLLADRQTTRDDPRVTPLGSFLRRFSLDELPQLWNVLNGTMSLVGPRPHAPNTKADNILFHEAVSDYALRHRMKPGITGWAQVNGWRGETRSVDQIRQRVAYDLHYIDNWSMPLDLRIIFLTIKREIFSSTAF